MHSYLQRHIRTHGSGVSLPCSGGEGKDGVVVKANVGGVTTTTTLLNPITLETHENSGSLIVSQPALNIPPNTSQNYFMIQTASGLQLIPLSSPVPAPPPPPPPPPAQPQNYLLLQCPSNNGSQSSLILVPTANNPPPAQETQTLPMLQSFQAVQSVLNQTPQTQISQFSTLSQQQQQQQTRIIITSNNNMNSSVAMSTQTPSANSLLTKPILGRTTRTGGRRGRKPKSALQKAQSSVSQKAGGAPAAPVSHVTSVAQASAVANTATGSSPSSNPMMSHCPLTTSCNTVSIHSTSSSVAPLVDASGPPSAASVVSPATALATVQVSAPTSATPETSEHTTLEEMRTEETLTEKQFVLCFDNEGESKEGMGGSYVLQFEDGVSGGTVDGGVVSEGNSLVLQIKTNGQRDVEKEGDKGGMMSLLHDWGEEKQEGGQTGEEGNQGESYVLHFHTDGGNSPTSGTFSRGQEASLQLTCTRNSSLVPLDGQEVVFELGTGTKMEQAPEEGMQMIALIGDEGGMAGEMSHCGAAGGGVTEDGGAMEGIFQLESGEGIVIIEVSTSGLRDGGMERGEAREICQTGAAAEAKEATTQENNHADGTEVPTSAEDALTNGPLHEKEMRFPD